MPLPPSLTALRRRVTPLRLGVVAAVVTLAFSQLVLRLIASNPAEFPEQARFHLGILFWAWALPLAALLALDLLLVPDDEASGPVAHGWRCALYTLTALSFARQFQVLYAKDLVDSLDSPYRLLMTGLLALLVWAVLARLRIRFHRYFGALGLLALLLVGHYAWSVGLWGPAWRGSREDQEIRGDPSKPPVFALLFDELSFDVLAGPDGRPDRARYPHLAALADDGVWFVNATTNAHLTSNAVRIMLAGRLRAPDEADAGPLLFDHLPPGYVAEAMVAWPPVARWIREREASNPRFARNTAPFFLPSFFELPGRILRGLPHSGILAKPSRVGGSFEHPANWEHRDASDRLRVETRALLDAVPRARGRFLWWHSSLPHFPFQFDESGVPHGEAAESFLDATPAGAEEALKNYRRQVRALDAVIGGFTAALKQAGLYEEAIVVLTSDHGLRTWRMDAPPSTDPLARVPLLLKRPGLAPGVRDTDYQHVDFIATVLDLMGAPAPPTSGVSALRAERPAREKWMDYFRGERWTRGASGGVWTR